ncbi:uncharacterized protein [Nicotiana sylvestris]|uniref:uncharacterized protein n=1 Tax=Nicotiana sylvestris TaxID=4096 RepID=UPI00388C6738
MGDSDLIIQQAQGEWETRDVKLLLYRQHVNDLRKWFKSVEFRYHDIKRFLKTKEYLEQASGDQKRTIRRLASGFFLSGEVLYKRTPNLSLLGYMDVQESGEIMNEVHAGAHVDLIHAPPFELHPMLALWSFVAWGMDIIGLIESKASNGHRFILVAIDYFTKWVEASFDEEANGIVEATNKNMKKILRKMIQSSRQSHEKLPFALLGYRTTVRTSVGATPYLLVYGTEAVKPVDVKIPSLRIIIEAEIEDSEWVKTRLEQLTLIDEKRMVAVCHGQLYQQRTARAYNKKVWPRNFEGGQLVLRCILPHHKEAKRKFAPNWKGP